MRAARLDMHLARPSKGDLERLQSNAARRALCDESSRAGFAAVGSDGERLLLDILCQCEDHTRRPRPRQAHETFCVLAHDDEVYRRLLIWVFGDLERVEPHENSRGASARTARTGRMLA